MPSAIASAWPRMIVSGVRNSWAMSATTERRRVSSASRRLLMSLRARASDRTSAGPPPGRGGGVFAFLDAGAPLDQRAAGPREPAQDEERDQDDHRPERKRRD